MRGVREVFLCGESSCSLRSSKAKKRSKRCRGEAGASLLEYALVIALVPLIAIPSTEELGKVIGFQMCKSIYALTTDEPIDAQLWAVNGWGDPEAWIGYGTPDAGEPGEVKCIRKFGNGFFGSWVEY